MAWIIRAWNVTSRAPRCRSIQLTELYRFIMMPGWAADHSFRRAQKPTNNIQVGKIKGGRNHHLRRQSKCVRVCDYILTIYGETAISSAVLRIALFIRLRLKKAKEAPCPRARNTRAINIHSLRFRVITVIISFPNQRKEVKTRER